MRERGPVARIAAASALAGGAVLLATAALTTVSVLLRWWTSQPVKGDFELVSLGSGLAVLGFLAWGSVTRSNILVDSFTTWLPARVNAALDAFWSLAWAAATLLIAERMARGAIDTWASNMRTMGLLALPYWWAIAVGALCFALAGISALLTIPRLLR
ncbi:TRAP transporter small permease [Roseococcus sp. SYP-B2431]|uniref:TRAP transporter small permease n=1 Tax=Roseococcus sp. SYP-B2431 TaxID=2496640 RepID=UPI001F0F01B4|nr:TRAP transporter small permease subunit [Roseococcus sp. SYP-B2431]